MQLFTSFPYQELGSSLSAQANRTNAKTGLYVSYSAVCILTLTPSYFNPNTSITEKKVKAALSCLTVVLVSSNVVSSFEV
jgi:hypothetical protein